MGKFTAFKVPLKSLPQGVHEFKYRLDKTFFINMESDDIHDADVSVQLKLNHKADIYDFCFTVEGEVTLQCDRCLDDLIFPISTSYHIVVKYGEDYDDSSDDLLVIPESDNSLNVAYMLYDTVALAIPIKHVHPTGKCNRQMSAMLRKHSATESHADETDDIDIDDMQTGSRQEATDSRWDALRNFSPED